ncbi:MAG TPA: hypothetical protein VII79_01090, partial [Candidatus Dormibacteraeota bacterium]
MHDRFSRYCSECVTARRVAPRQVGAAVPTKLAGRYHRTAVRARDQRGQRDGLGRAGLAAIGGVPPLATLA